jgi:hypothetical protein
VVALTPRAPSLSQSQRLDKNIDASLGATLQQIYSAGSKAGYVMYNGELHV